MRNLFLILVTLFSLNVSLACDSLDDASKNIDVNTWLGDRSKFSKAFKNGRCALDQALEELSKSERMVIANLIAKSYKETKKEEEDLVYYNY